MGVVGREVEWRNGAYEKTTKRAMQQWVLTHVRIIGEQLQSRVEGSEVPSVTNCFAMIPFYMGGGLAGSTTAM